MENHIQIKRIKKPLKVGVAKCPEEAVSSLDIWPGKSNFLAYPPFDQTVVNYAPFFRAIEIQMQCPKDFYNHQGRIRSAISLCQANNLEVTFHIPFMHIDDNKKVHFMPLVAPASLDTLPDGFGLIEMNPQLVKDIVDFGIDLNVGTATMHITWPRTRYINDDWKRFYEKFAPLFDYAFSKKFDLSIETGGATLEEIIRLVESFKGLKVTDDIVHANMDGIDPVQLYLVLRQIDPKTVNKFHICESELLKDQHKPLKEGGIYNGIIKRLDNSVIKDILASQFTSSPYSPHFIFESPVSEEAAIDPNVSVFYGIADDIRNRHKVLIMTNGLTQTGKSTIVNNIADYLSTSNLDIRVIGTDRERPIEQHEATLNGYFVPKPKRADVYMQILEKVEECYSDGADVVAVDGTFGVKEWRKMFVDLVQKKGYSLYIIKTVCSDPETMHQRLGTRNIDGIVIPVPSEVYSNLAKEFEPLDPSEIGGVDATVICFDSYTQNLIVESGKRQVSEIANAITRTLLSYGEAVGSR